MSTFLHKYSTCFVLSIAFIHNSSAMYINEDFTIGKVNHAWIRPLPQKGENRACLTVGVSGGVPKCSGINDPIGSGALRLTNSTPNEVGGLISGFQFPSNEGVDLTFITYTYGGNGADGMSFFLTDGSQPITLGASGGGLGYACVNKEGNNGVYDGVSGGYIGVGIDEYGTFLSHEVGTKSIGFTKNAISLRGAGALTLKQLNKQYPRYFPTSGNKGLISLRNTCMTGSIHDGNNDQRIPVLAYPVLGHQKVSESIFTSAKTRKEAIPISYKMKITPDAKLSFWWSYNGGTYQPILIDKDIKDSNGPLPDKFRFGFAGSTGMYKNIHEVSCFKASPNEESGGSVGVNTPNGKVQTNTQIYSTIFNPKNWTGKLLSNGLTKNKDGEWEIYSIPYWEASCGLDNMKCDNQVNAPLFSDLTRNIWTYDLKKGTPLSYTKLDSELKNKLNQYGDGELKVNYLRGDSSVAHFRGRKSLLADIIDSSPVVVSIPMKKSYSGKDSLYIEKNNSDSERMYTQFQRHLNSRQNIVYTASNDGILHGFRTGYYDESGTKFINKDNDGKEVFSYISRYTLNLLAQPREKSLDLFSNQYAHNFYNNASPSVGEVFYRNEWHTVLISGLGAGGAAIFALDITDPKNMQSDEKSDPVIGEWGYQSQDKIWKNLGNTYGSPEIVRFHNGEWGAIFGNGWCSKSDLKNGNCNKSNSSSSGIYIMTFDLNTGLPKFKWISLPEQIGDNGIAYTSAIDLDNDGVVDFVYAGDLQGNVWRVSLTSKLSSDWGKPKKIFQTKNKKPITTKIIPIIKDKKVVLNFGTGEKSEGYLFEQNSYVDRQQSIYGVWDSEIGQEWNTLSKQVFPITIHGNISDDDLLKRDIDFKTNQINNTQLLCWADLKTCGKKQYGWVIDLQILGTASKHEYEQVIYSPAMKQDIFFVNTYLDKPASVNSCSTSTSTGYTYALDPMSGKAQPKIFGKDDTGLRQELGAIGTPSFIEVDGKTLLISKDKSGQITLIPIIEKTNMKLKRLSWRELT